MNKPVMHPCFLFLTSKKLVLFVRAGNMAVLDNLANYSSRKQMEYQQRVHVRLSTFNDRIVELCV